MPLMNSLYSLEELDCIEKNVSTNFELMTYLFFFSRLNMKLNTETS